MHNKLYQEIYDNLYGYIELDRGRYGRILGSPYFLRLQNIKQMGLTHFVFPGAVHSRYSHSLGVFAIVKKMLETQPRLLGKVGKCLEDDDIELIEMSALLHDIGHLPLSHTIEQALDLYQKHSNQREESEDTPSSTFLIRRHLNTTSSVSEEAKANKKENDAGHTKLHERLGEVVLRRSDFAEHVDKHYPIENISAIFKGARGDSRHPLPLGLLHGRHFMHSQVDADRLDYLMRDSSFTGVKSGAIDFDKLLMELRYSRDGKFGVSCAGLRVLEQFFMARFAAYSQVPFNPKVHAVNYMATDFYYRMLMEAEQSSVLASRVPDYDRVVSMVENDQNRWLQFTDSFFFQLVADVVNRKLVVSDQLIKEYASLLCLGKPLKVVCHREVFYDADHSVEDRLLHHVRERKQAMASRLGINPDYIIVPEKSVRVSVLGKKDDDDVHLFSEQGVTPLGSAFKSSNSFLRLFNGTILTIERIFTVNETIQKKLQLELRGRGLIDNTGAATF